MRDDAAWSVDQEWGAMVPCLQAVIGVGIQPRPSAHLKSVSHG